MLKTFAKYLITCVILFTATTHSFSQENIIRNLYIDSLAQEFISLLEEDSIFNYIVYSETIDPDKKIAKEKDCKSDKILYVLWEKDEKRYMKKFSYCFDYQYVKVDYEQLLYDLFDRFKCLDDSGFEQYCNKKRRFYNKQQSSLQDGKTVFDIYARYYGQEHFLITTKKEYFKYDNIIFIFRDFLSKNNKYFCLKQKYSIGDDFIKTNSANKETHCNYSFKPIDEIIKKSSTLKQKWAKQNDKLKDGVSKIEMGRVLRNSKYKEIYLDSLAEMYVKKLKNDGINDYIIYSEIKQPQFNWSKNLYLIWLEDTDTAAFIKKMDCFYDYEPINIDISKLIDFILRNEGELKKYSTKESYQKTKNEYYNSPYCSRRYRKPIAGAEIHLDGTNIYHRSQINWSNEYDRLTQIIKKIVVQNKKSFRNKSKYSVPKSFMQKYVDDINKMEAYKTEIIKEWLNDSLPIHEDSLKLKPRLVRETYYLYEYLMQKDTFITGHYYRKERPNFWVTGISVGQYEKDSTFLSYEERKKIERTYIDDFHPKPFRGYKMLYPNEKIMIYINTQYCKYGRLPVSMNYHGYMSGVHVPQPSFPEIGPIYFNKNYTEAQVYYSTGYTYSVCMIRKTGKDWELVENQTIMHVD